MGGKDLQVAIEISEMIVVVNAEVKFYVGFCRAVDLALITGQKNHQYYLCLFRVSKI